MRRALRRWRRRSAPRSARRQTDRLPRTHRIHPGRSWCVVAPSEKPGIDLLASINADAHTTAWKLVELDVAEHGAGLVDARHRHAHVVIGSQHVLLEFARAPGRRTAATSARRTDCVANSAGSAFLTTTGASSGALYGGAQAATRPTPPSERRLSEPTRRARSSHSSVAVCNGVAACDREGRADRVPPAIPRPSRRPAS